jgi:hypothetical protein
MERWMTSLALVSALAAAGWAQEAGDGAPTPLEQVEALERSYEDAQKEFSKLYAAAVSDEERQKLFEEKYPKPDAWVPRFRVLAEQHAGTPAAARALVWVVRRAQSTDPACLKLLIEHHLNDPILAQACSALWYGRSEAAEVFLRTCLEKSVRSETRAQACYSLAKVLLGQGRTAERLADPVQAEELEQWMDAGELAFLRARDAAACQKEAQELLVRVCDEFADALYIRDRTLGAKAEGDLFEIQNLGIGKVAPDISGTDQSGDAFKLSDYRGKVVVLDFWGFW